MKQFVVLVEKSVGHFMFTQPYRGGAVRTVARTCEPSHLEAEAARALVQSEKKYGLFWEFRRVQRQKEF